MKFLSSQPAAEAGSTLPHLWQVLDAANNRSLVEIDATSGYGSQVHLNWVSPQERSRKVVKRSNFRMTGKFPSRKIGRMVQWESRLELDAIRVLETHPTVLAYREQPATLTWSDWGVFHRHYPDLHVNLRNSAQLLIEIKSDRDALHESIQARTNYLVPELRKHGIFYLVVSGSQLKGVPQENAKHILKHATRKLDPATQERIRVALRFPETLKHLDALLGASYRSAILELIRTGRVLFDATQILCGTTVVTWNEGH
jgi:hypothetical protein